MRRRPEELPGSDRDGVSDAFTCGCTQAAFRALLLRFVIHFWLLFPFGCLFGRWLADVIVDANHVPVTMSAFSTSLCRACSTGPSGIRARPTPLDS